MKIVCNIVFYILSILCIYNTIVKFFSGKLLLGLTWLFLAIWNIVELVE